MENQHPEVPKGPRTAFYLYARLLKKAHKHLLEIFLEAVWVEQVGSGIIQTSFWLRR